MRRKGMGAESDDNDDKASMPETTSNFHLALSGWSVARDVSMHRLQQDDRIDRLTNEDMLTMHNYN